MPNPTAFGNEEDTLLVTAVLKGDMGAFKKLISLYEKLVVSIVFKMIGRVEDCEDICQDVFLKVYEKLAAFRFQSKLSTWIGSIAFNTCVNFLQKRKAILMDDIIGVNYTEEEQPVNLPVMETGNNPGEQLEDKERHALLQKGIENLSLIQKTVLQLFHQNEMSLQEISAITTLPVSTIKSHLFRARKHLKVQMNNY
ncbi:MAG TPA: sigma-70 family RNA polymerase sigma factor [Ferruginibacter sp.]|nr:sigma-70 family RNA polymerase sigma factor [Ferruginibacter sp.]